MKINLVEKFDLYERLEDLISAVQENEEISKIVNSGLHDLKKNFYVPRFNQLMTEMQNYKWISQIDTFITECEDFIKSNKYGLTLEALSETLKSNGSTVYKPLIEKINQLCPLDESVIQSKMHELASFKYEPNVRNILSLYEKEKFGSVEKEEVKISKDVVSPIIESEKGYIFTVKGKNYFTSSDLSVLETYEGKTDTTFEYAKKALNTFKYLGEGIFIASFPKGKIEVTVNESNKIKMSINGTPIKDKQALTHTLKHSGIVQYSDNATRSLVEFMYENANKYISLDFAKVIETKDSSYEVFKMSEDVYITKFNPGKRIFELCKMDMDDVQELQESLSKKYKVDFTMVLENLSINKEGMEFAKLVECIDLDKLTDITTTKTVLESIENANKFYKGMKDKKGTDVSYGVLENVSALVNSEKMKFLISSREGVATKLDEGLKIEGAFNLLNDEIKSLISTFK